VTTPVGFFPKSRQADFNLMTWPAMSGNGATRCGKRVATNGSCVAVPLPASRVSAVPLVASIDLLQRVSTISGFVWCADGRASTISTDVLQTSRWFFH